MRDGSRVKFRNSDCIIRARKYGNGNLAIELLEADTQDHYLTCTVNAGKIDSPNAIAVKDYSEDEGVLDFLKKVGLVGRTLYTMQSGFVIIPVVELTESGLELFGEAKEGSLDAERRMMEEYGEKLYSLRKKYHIPCRKKKFELIADVERPASGVCGGSEVVKRHRFDTASKALAFKEEQEMEDFCCVNIYDIEGNKWSDEELKSFRDAASNLGKGG